MGGGSVFVPNGMRVLHRAVSGHGQTSPAQIGVNGHTGAGQKQVRGCQHFCPATAMTSATLPAGGLSAVQYPGSAPTNVRNFPSHQSQAASSRAVTDSPNTKPPSG